MARTKATHTPDICVIGAGSGGLVVAAAAASFGVDVVLIEKGKMGGDCLNYGCVPSKAIIAAGKHAHAMRKGAAFGVSLPEGVEPHVDFGAVNDHIQSVIATIAPMDSQERFEGLGVTVLREHGRFIDARTVQAGDAIIRARRFVVATGSAPFVPPIDGIEDVAYETNETLFERREAPGHLIVIGGGPIGMEMAHAHARLGAQVTVVEGETALGKDDPELARIAIDAIRADGVDVRERTRVAKLERGEGGASAKAQGVRVHVETQDGKDVIEGDTLLIATGRAATVQDLGLDEAGIEHTRKGITVGANLRTSNRRVYAVGDVHGGLQFTHMAGYEAGVVIRSLLFRLPAKADTSIIPWATYTEPELANVGLTEAAARDRHGDRFAIHRFPFAENDRAQAERKASGLVKVITKPDGTILGAGIVGPHAGETIHLFALALEKGMKLKDLAGYVAPYPTLSEVGKRAATASLSHWPKKGWVRGVVKFLQSFG